MSFASHRRDNPRLKCLRLSFLPFYAKSISSDLPAVCANIILANYFRTTPYVNHKRSCGQYLRKLPMYHYVILLLSPSNRRGGGGNSYDNNEDDDCIVLASRDRPFIYNRMDFKIPTLNYRRVPTGNANVV